MANHVYTSAGNYTLTLTVVDNGGAQNSAAQVITVIQPQPPVADLKVTSASSGVVPFIASFDASSSTDPQNRPLSFTWDFGDGTISNNAALQVTHQYNAIGTYTVTLTVANNLAI
jgi:PKD repeat protein